MPSPRIVRTVLGIALSFFAFGAECDFGEIVAAFCAQHPDNPQCEFCSLHPNAAECQEEEEEEPLPPEKTVFVTSSFHAGADLGGLAGADAICNGLASDAGLPGSFVAWLSTSSVDARDRITEPAGDGFVRTDGAVVASSIADLLDDEIQNPIQLDEDETSYAGGAVWTGTATDGTKLDPNHCEDWTGTDPSGRFGALNGTNYSWTNTGGNGNCTSELQLYCFQI